MLVHHLAWSIHSCIRCAITDSEKLKLSGVRHDSLCLFTWFRLFLIALTDLLEWFKCLFIDFTDSWSLYFIISSRSAYIRVLVVSSWLSFSVFQANQLDLIAFDKLKSVTRLSSWHILKKRSPASTGWSEFTGSFDFLLALFSLLSLLLTIILSFACSSESRTTRLIRTFWINSLNRDKLKVSF